MPHLPSSQPSFIHPAIPHSLTSRASHHVSTQQFLIYNSQPPFIHLAFSQSPSQPSFIHPAIPIHPPASHHLSTQQILIHPPSQPSFIHPTIPHSSTSQPSFIHPAIPYSPASLPSFTHPKIPHPPSCHHLSTQQFLILLNQPSFSTQPFLSLPLSQPLFTNPVGQPLFTKSAIHYLPSQPSFPHPAVHHSMTQLSII